MPVFDTSPAIDNALVNPASWADEHWVHEQFTWLRRNDPLRYLQPEGFEPFWSITRYTDIKAVEQNKKVFINDPRPTLAPAGMTEFIQQMTGRKHLFRSLGEPGAAFHAHRNRRLSAERQNHSSR